MRAFDPRCLRCAGLLLASATVACSILEGGTISGRVLNGATGQFLAAAEVEVAGLKLATITDRDGFFRFDNVPAGGVTLRATYTGLEPSTQMVNVPDAGTLWKEIALSNKDYDGESQLLGEITVSAEREGNAKAISEQKHALNLKTVIASDTFGDVNEGNVGEFLKMLPGVSVDYGDADVRNARVRGLSPKYVSVTLDGHPIASAASSNITAGRIFEFEQISLANLDLVEVNKSPTADLAAAGMTGSVNLRSKSAFNLKGRQIRYSLNLAMNEYATSFDRTPGWDDREHAKWGIGGLLEVSETFLKNRFGIFAAATHSATYVEQKILNETHVFDRSATNNRTEFPVISAFNLQDGLKPTWRDTLVLNLDFRSSESLVLSLRSSFNAYDGPFHNRNWGFTSNRLGIRYGADGTLDDSSLIYLTNRTATGARSTARSATDTQSFTRVFGSNLRKHGSTITISPTLNWRRGQIAIDGSVSYSRADNRYDSAAEGFFSTIDATMNGVSWEYETHGTTGMRIRQIDTGASNPGSFLDLANYNSAVSVSAEQRSSTDQFWTTRADVTVDRTFREMPVTLKFGGASRLQLRDIENFNPSWRVTTGTQPGAIFLGDYRDPYVPRFRKGEAIIDNSGVLGAAPSADKWRLYDLFASYNTDPFALSYGTSQPFLANFAANMRNKLQSIWNVEERIDSAYAMATVELTRDLQLVSGLRLESTRTDGRTSEDIGHESAVAISGTTDRNNLGYILARFGSRVTRTKSYDNLLPSVQLRFAPNRATVLRAAYFHSVQRPDFSNVASGVGVSDAAPYSFTLSNANLEPETAHNLDFRLEHYFEPVGVISCGVFYKAISDIQIKSTSFIDPAAPPEQVAGLGYPASALDNATVTVGLNAGKSAIWGIEFDYSQQLSFLPNPFSGLGVFANATYNHPQNVLLFSLAAEDGIPPYTGNCGVSYKRGRFDCQVKLNWVDKRVRTVTGVIVDARGNIAPDPVSRTGTSRIEYTAARAQVDCNASYRCTPHASVFLSVTNVFDEPNRQFYERSSWLERHGAFGARYTLGLKGTF